MLGWYVKMDATVDAAQKQWNSRFEDGLGGFRLDVPEPGRENLGHAFVLEVPHHRVASQRSVGF